MSKAVKVWIGCAIVYFIVLETTIYGAVNHWHVNPWVSGNAQFVCIFGGIGLFCTGLFALMDGIGL